MEGAVGMSAGVVAATVLVPGIGAVFAFGFGAAALLGWSARVREAAMSQVASRDPSTPEPTKKKARRT